MVNQGHRQILHLAIRAVQVSLGQSEDSFLRPNGPSVQLLVIVSTRCETCAITGTDAHAAPERLERTVL